ncbi:dihydrodipicolinate reductase C-terminal domain-containing protein [Clostridioides difficile]|uniref:dihydrodipicolinate reductase C-terminal domain-containing protein n=1 Tax=Clostridioides difficile TaxID=1496 RepID=UPI001CE1152E
MRSHKEQPNEVVFHAIAEVEILLANMMLYLLETMRFLRISQQAQSRGIFASGSIAAAKYLVKQKPGFYNMDSMLG